MKVTKLGAAVCTIAAAVLMVGSIIQRDSGVMLWMPFAFYLGVFVLLVATFLLTYSPEEAREARRRLDAEAESEAADARNPR